MHFKLIYALTLHIKHCIDAGRGGGGVYDIPISTRVILSV